MREKGGNCLVPGLDYIVDALKLSNQAPRVVWSCPVETQHLFCWPILLDKHYSDFAPGKSTVEKWFAKFKRGEMSTEDNARSGRSKETVTDENIKQVHKIIFDNRKMKLSEIAETLKI
ncbi:putative DD34D transposase [Trichonephila clavipes]|nr:putative DD34D transposase [Trichonephila clavipes]